MRLFRPKRTIQTNSELPPFSRQELIGRIFELDGKAQEVCISFLEEHHPSVTREQSEKLIDLIFENNFKCRLPNHFGKLNEGLRFGFPYIWLLNELETGGIQYLYRNGIWQIHWDVGDRYNGLIGKRGKETVKYLVTNGPGEPKEAIRVWEEHKLVFWSYSGWRTFEYPIPEDRNVSCPNEFLESLKLEKS